MITPKGAATTGGGNRNPNSRAILRSSLCVSDARRQDGAMFPPFSQSNIMIAMTLATSLRQCPRSPCIVRTAQYSCTYFVREGNIVISQRRIARLTRNMMLGYWRQSGTLAALCIAFGFACWLTLRFPPHYRSVSRIARRTQRCAPRSSACAQHTELSVRARFKEKTTNESQIEFNPYRTFRFRYQLGPVQS